jgi:hypothetical protein
MHRHDTKGANVLACEHAEALALARRLQRSDPASAADDRRALLLFWYGSGASRLLTEENVLLAAWRRHGGEDHPLPAAITAERRRLAHEVEDIAADASSPAGRLRRVGHGLAALVLRQDSELRSVVELTVPAEELLEVGATLRTLRH